ncbi:MAG: asparagine synthase (glutamine-hydrolyzing) [Candidatus Njordarchaeales archaeon]
MCGIAGVYDFKSARAGEFLEKMLKALKHRGPDGSGFLIDDISNYGDLETLVFPEGRVGIGHNRLAITWHGLQPIRNEDNSLWIVHNGEIYNYKQLRSKLEKKGHRFLTSTDSEVILHAFEQGLLSELLGDYAFAIYDKKHERLLLYRDAVGIRPLFYGIGDGVILFASERKALREFSTSIHRLPPGHRMIIENNGYVIEEFENLVSRFRGIKKEKDLDRLLSELEERLILSIEARKYTPLGMFFSGGVDSSVIAKLAANQGIDITLFSAGLKDSHDLKWARKVAEILKLPLEERVIREDEIEELLRKTVRAIDETDPLKVLIGIPIYATAEKARECGFRVMFSGQGADELFGGYARYLRSSDPVQEMVRDFANLYLNNLERDDHCAMANSIEVRYPYLDIRVVEVAFKTPLEYKICGGLRKYILRKLGRKIGLPKEVCEKPKKAVQYGTGVTKFLKKMAKRKSLSLRDYIIKVLEEEMIN